MKTPIPNHILLQLRSKNARSHKSAIKFRAEDYKNATELEYTLVRYFLNELNIKQYRIISQTLMLDRFYKVFDLIEVKVNHSTVMKFWFNISETFGRYDPHNHHQQKNYYQLYWGLPQ
jgi:hypothetical protein